ncbi:MAG: hypothetical protein ACRD2O_00980, partial [Terriglobia bacterium]
MNNSQVSPQPPAIDDSGTQAASLQSPNRFIARQPILDAKCKTFGYELLFRSGAENLFTGADGDKATEVVIDSLF